MNDVVRALFLVGRWLAAWEAKGVRSLESMAILGVVWVLVSDQ
jgi:hypothetical protein